MDSSHFRLGAGVDSSTEIATVVVDHKGAPSCVQDSFPYVSITSVALTRILVEMAVLEGQTALGIEDGTSAYGSGMHVDLWGKTSI